MRLQHTPNIERLEARRLLSAAVVDGALIVTGTEGDDSMSVSINASHFVVSDNGVETAFDRAVVQTIRMIGLGGNDTLQVLSEDVAYDVPVHSDGGAGNDFVDGASRNDTLLGGDGDDFIFGYGGDDQVSGGAGADFIVGMEGNDLLHGDGDADQVYGGEGNDLLFGDDGDDQLYGDVGSDDLDGGLGADLLDGGEDADRFIVPDEFDTMINDGTDIVYVPPPPEEEFPCGHSHKNHEQGHGNHYGILKHAGEHAHELHAKGGKGHNR